MFYVFSQMRADNDNRSSRMTGKETRGTVSMKGGGYYSANTKGAKDVIDNTGSLALDAIANVDIGSADSAAPFSIADYGAADGGTSIDLVRRLIEYVRGQVPEREISITYTDLPRNDYSALFMMLDGARADIRSYLEDHDSVYTFASGTSFYRPILPRGSLDFGFSATAMHWLSRLPGIISDHVHAVGATGAELETFRAQAMQDWENILLQRAKELRPGGRLVMSNFCIDEQGRYLGNTDGINMFDTFNRLWQNMADRGDITQDEYTATAFPQFYKTIEEYSAPLLDTNSVVHQAGLRLVNAETRVVPCPYAAEFATGGDPAEFAVAYVPTLRSWSETVFLQGLSDARPLEERQQLVDQFYQAYIDEVAADPTGHAMDYVHVYMTVEKV